MYHYLLVLAGNSIIRNLYINNYYISSNYYYLSVFGASRNITFENVHLENITLESTTPGSGIQNIALMSNAEGAIIKNCTANNVKIKVENRNSETYIGGFSALGSVDIENSYINNLVIEESNNANIVSIGGLVGYASSNNSNIKNSYVIGKIHSNSGNIGGIVGYGTYPITNSYACVDIEGNGDYLGGIIGRETSSEPQTKNNLYIGSIINKKMTGITGALAGNNIIGNNNYAYYKNKVNGQLVNVKNILNYKDLLKTTTYYNKLAFDDNYNYQTIQTGVLPKLNYTNSNELLPNQTDIFLPSEELAIENIEKLRIDNNNLQIQVTITNPDNLTIKDLVIDDMEYTILTNRNVDGKTYLTIQGSPTKYYDTYRISKIIYEKNGKEENEELYDLIEESFYKEISNFSDWQSIDEDGYENYRILADIDFSGKMDFKYNIKINKMVTDGQMHTLKNINLYTNSGSFGLIQESKSLIENINFENIKIENGGSSGNYIGVISNNHGNINNISFKDITLLLNTNNDYVGCIANNDGFEIEKISLENINISANYYTGGLFGSANAAYIREIDATNVNVTGVVSVGGIIGLRSRLTNDELSNIVIKDSTIEGSNYIGGIWGSTNSNSRLVQNVEVINCNIEGNSYVGGVSGASGYNTEKIKFVKVKDSTVEGVDNVGGIFGTGGNTQYGIVENSKLIATDVNSTKIGGITGSLSWNLEYSGVLNTTIQTLATSVGGAIGYGSSAGVIYVLGTTVEGYSKVGGLVGETALGTLSNSYTNANVTAIRDYAGGVAGYLENTNMDNIFNIISLINDYYAGGTIQGKKNIGGIIGGIAKKLYNETGKNYYGTYVEATLVSEDRETTSLGIGSTPEENKNIINSYYYKYSNINGKNPNEENEEYISQDQYLVSSDLKLRTTYVQKLKFPSTYWYFDGLGDNKYPVIQVNNIILEGQNGIDIPIDEEHVLENVEMQSEVLKESLENTFEYNNKTIQTYSTYSVITAENGSQVTRNAKLYVKDSNLYALPTVLSGGQTSNTEEVVPIANNLIIDSYNGKEYETILGSDGKIYDLKEPIKYPENFVNEDIESIGNNLNSDSHEIEVTYKNGDTIKFNYQTGEVISSSEGESTEQVELFDYIKGKLSDIGNSTSDELSSEIASKYEASKELQTKLEEISVEEVLEKQGSSTEIDGLAEDDTATENEVTNNSLKENKYMSVYDVEIDDYQIYKEEELLDTSKEEVVSENEKIEANNLSDYYASEGKTRNTKMGIVWIVMSIIGVGIILIILKKRQI